jgi:uncharacterized protein YjbJ (UPF0337 family)
MSTRHKRDQLIGRAKEITGKLTGNDRLRLRGLAQRGVATAKEATTDAASTAAETVKDAARKVSDSAKDANKKSR